MGKAIMMEDAFKMELLQEYKIVEPVNSIRYDASQLDARKYATIIVEAVDIVQQSGDWFYINSVYTSSMKNVPHLFATGLNVNVSNHYMCGNGSNFNASKSDITMKCYSSANTFTGTLRIWGVRI